MALTLSPAASQPEYFGDRPKAGASLFFVASALMCVVFLVGAYTVIAPEEKDQPCDGECEDCEEDRNCKAWVRGVEKKHDVVAICPPTKGSAKTDATFSCLADGWWMLVTSLIGGVWLVAAYCIVRMGGRGADGARDVRLRDCCSIQLRQFLAHVAHGDGDALRRPPLCAIVHFAPNRSCNLHIFAFDCSVGLTCDSPCVPVSGV